MSKRSPAAPTSSTAPASSDTKGAPQSSENLAWLTHVEHTASGRACSGDLELNAAALEAADELPNCRFLPQ